MNAPYRAWVAVHIASFLFPYRECSALILRSAASFSVTWMVQGQVSSVHRFQLLTSGFSVTWYCCVHSPRKVMCRNATTAGKSKGSNFFNTLAEKKKKNVVFIYIFPQGVLQGSLMTNKPKSNTANIINVTYEVSHLTCEPRILACGIFLFPQTWNSGFLKEK